MSGLDVFGPEDAPSVLFLHGAGSNRKMWASHNSISYRAIAPDLPGHGARSGVRFTLDEAVAVGLEAIDHTADGRAFLCGSSLGGYVAISIAAARPEAALGLILQGSSASYLGWGGFSTRIYGVVMGLVGPRLLPKAEASLRSLSDEVAKPILDVGLSMRGAADALRDLPGNDFHALLARYRGPVLILNGETDKVNRKEEHAAAERLANVQIAVIENAGHACAITQPVAFRRAVEEFVLAHGPAVRS